MPENEQSKEQYATWQAPKERESKAEKIQQLFGHCFAINKFEDSDNIPVGGDNVFSQEVNVGIKGDFGNFAELYQEATALAEKYDLSQLAEWLKSQEIDMNPKLFAIIFAFTKVYEKRYPDNAERAHGRRKLYEGKAKDIRLSDIFNANVAECAEIAALAQYHLQEAGVDSKYISGDVLWDKEWEFSEEHSFLEIKDGEKTYIYDPTNPVNTSQGKFPSIYTTEANFDEEIHKDQKRFVTAKNLLSKKEAFYGVNNGTNVWAERDVI